MAYFGAANTNSFHLYSAITPDTGLKRKTDTCLRRCRGVHKPQHKKWLQRIAPKRYFAATPTKRSGGIFPAIHKKRPNVPKGTVKPHTQLQIAALISGFSSPIGAPSMHRYWEYGKNHFTKEVLSSVPRKEEPARSPPRVFALAKQIYFLLLANSLNGTFLSTRISCGRPSTCSDTILRKISSVPPAIR